MTDRELLEAAAKAAGIEIEYIHDDLYRRVKGIGAVRWNPLNDDGDALRLAVQVGIDVYTAGESVVQAIHHKAKAYADEPVVYGRFTATRRAIVRAAAEIGRGDGMTDHELMKQALDAPDGHSVYKVEAAISIPAAFAASSKSSRSVIA